SDGAPPSSNEDVFIDNNVTGPTIDSTIAAVSGIIRMGGTGTTDILTVTGGSLNDSSHLILGESSGTTANLNISGGTVTAYSVWAGNNGNGIVNMASGTINITNEKLYVSRFGTGQGYIYLNGGTIIAPDIYMNGGLIDITGGTLIISGDKRGTINGYISGNWITGDGGTIPLNVVYNGTNTTVTAQSNPYAWNPYPSNVSVDVDADVVLSWSAGYDAVSHDVYFGTSTNPPFIQTQTATTYNPSSTLAASSTYYWRIDEYDGIDTYQGDVWSFTIQPENLGEPVFDCNTFRLEFDPSGTSGIVSSLIYKPDSRELITGTYGNDGFVVYDTGGSDISLTNVSRTYEGKLLAKSADGSYQVLLDVVEDDKHIAFRIESLIGFDPAENSKLRFRIRPTLSSTFASAVPARYGEGIGVGVMALDWMTWSESDFQVEWRYLWNRAINATNPLGGFVIFVCDESQTLETIGKVEDKEGIPHPVYDGQFAKQNNGVARLSEMYVGFSGDTERNRAVDYCQQGGIGVFYLPQGVWESGSPYTVNTWNWPNGKDSLRDFSQLLDSKGMLLGIHTGSCSLRGSDSVYVKPIPDSRLASWGSGSLASGISQSDSVIYFYPHTGTVIPTNTSEIQGLRPPTYHNIWGWEKIQIGNEIITVGSYDDNSYPWVLSGCSRGQEGTTAASHNSSDYVKGLLTVYNRLAVDPDSTLLGEIADKMSDLVNYCKIDRLSFDALETAESSGRWGINKFMAKVFDGFDHFVATDSSSGLPQYEWHVSAFTNCGEPMHFYPKAYFDSYLIGNDNDNFVPQGLGAITFREDSRTSAWHASSLDEWQWWLAKAAAYDATFWFWTSVGELDGNGETSEILDLCKKWERAKLMNVFTPSQRTQMKDYYTSFRLTSSDINDFIWEVTPTKIEPSFVQPDDTLSFYNYYSAQPLRFEARVLPYYDYASASNMNLLPADVTGLSIDSDLTVTKNGDEWTLTSNSSSARQANRSISTTDLSYKRGVGLWIKGDGQGGYFYIEYSSGEMQRHYIVPNDFTDWRYVEIPDFEQADYYYRDQLYYQFQNPYTTIRQGFRYHAIGTISFGLLGKAGASVIIKEPKALAE
nr:hypothetical protein [Planctomycetota bacterium]